MDGEYTIQWAWYGGSSFNGNAKLGQASYQSCMDFTVTGGNPMTSKDTCPVFRGGDASFPGSDKCLVFVTGGKQDIAIPDCNPDGCQVFILTRSV